MKILGYTSLSTEEKEALLGKSFLPPDTRASLGDTLAENYFIKRYHEEATFQSRASLAMHLGYIGTSKCLNILAASLDTQITRATVSDSISIRYYILKSLSYRYTDALLTSQLEQEKEYQANRSIFLDNSKEKTYMQLVAHWVQKEFKIKIKPESNFLYQKKITVFR